MKITRHFCVNSYSKNPLSFSLAGMRMKMKLRTSDGDYENADYVPSKKPSLLLFSWDEDEDDPSLCPLLSK